MKIAFTHKHTENWHLLLYLLKDEGKVLTKELKDILAKFSSKLKGLSADSSKKACLIFNITL